MFKSGHKYKDIDFAESAARLREKNYCDAGLYPLFRFISKAYFFLSVSYS